MSVASNVTLCLITLYLPPSLLRPRPRRATIVAAYLCRNLIKPIQKNTVAALVRHWMNY